MKTRLLLAIVLLLSLSSIGYPVVRAWAASDQPTAAYTPARGDPERRAIMDALRQYLFEYVKIRMVFVVQHLKVHGDWAYLETLPQSEDGASHYEPVVALMKRQGGRWTVVDLPSTGEPEDEDKPLTETYPEAPQDIFTR